MENSKRSKLPQYILMFCAFLIYSGTTVCAKYAAMENGMTFRFFLFLGLEVFTLGVYALLWQQVLKSFSLVTAMSSKGIVVIFSLMWSVFLFQEKISIFNMVGAAFIMAGIWRVSTDD